MKKNLAMLALMSFVVMLMPSCLGSGDETDVSAYKDAQIASFVLSHDSIASLGSLKFTIDQINGYIFNMDSLPYGTQIEKVICTVTYRSGTNGVQVTQEALGDSTIVWNGSDSLDFSRPVKFVTYAYDGMSKKTYTAKVNIHQVQPDTMVWERYLAPVAGFASQEMKVLESSGQLVMYTKTSEGLRRFISTWPANTWNPAELQGLPAATALDQICVLQSGTSYAVANNSLYSSSDGASWSQTAEAPAVKAILGALKADRNKPSLLTAVIESEGQNYFAAMDESGEWTQGEAVPDNFPLKGFATAQYEQMGFEYLLAGGGRDLQNRLVGAVWGTSNGMQWSQLTRKNFSSLIERESPIIVRYDNMLYLTGGFGADGTVDKTIYQSPDNGISWTSRDSLILFPDEYILRGNASAATYAGHLYLFGGKTGIGSLHLDEIWRGHINRLLFEN
ncbi:MAG: DUF6242 domain-containing protein [Tannerellaceae bacterium]|jgi:hypothetical protein|nr:DUF6242 domain-containing protein [Tannerellaceae bacterium]